MAIRQLSHYFEQKVVELRILKLGLSFETYYSHSLVRACYNRVYMQIFSVSASIVCLTKLALPYPHSTSDTVDSMR